MHTKKQVHHIPLPAKFTYPRLIRAIRLTVVPARILRFTSNRLLHIHNQYLIPKRIKYKIITHRTLFHTEQTKHTRTHRLIIQRRMHTAVPSQRNP